MTNESRVVELLENFLNNSMSSQEVLAAWPPRDQEESPLLFRCWDAIYDYNVDSDIRAKDPEYDTILREGIRDQLMELKSDDGL